MYRYVRWARQLTQGDRMAKDQEATGKVKGRKAILADFDQDIADATRAVLGALDAVSPESLPEVVRAAYAVYQRAVFIKARATGAGA